jgi:outer membrane protein assembly factor BamD (BamD/ComL family)
MRHTRTIVVFLFALSVPFGGVHVADLAAAGPQVPSRANAEFPAYDTSVWDAQRQGLLEKVEPQLRAAAPDSPEALDAVLEIERRPPDLNNVREGARLRYAIDVLRRVVEKHPEQTGKALELFSFASQGGLFTASANNVAEVKNLLEAIRKQLPSMSREQAADVSLRLGGVEAAVPVSQQAQPTLPRFGGSGEFEKRLRQVVSDYPGTFVALKAEVDLITSTVRPVTSQIDALDRFVAAHPQTTAAAYALYQEGWQLGRNVQEPRGADPTNRLMREIEIARELESGRYPPSEWVKLAPSLVVGFYPWEPAYGAANVERVIDACRAFVLSHFVLDEAYPADNGIGYLVTGTVWLVARQGGNGLERMERFLSDVEQGTRDPGARYLRALFYMKCMRDEPPAERPSFMRKAIDTLSAVREEGNGLYARKALATLACLYFFDRDFPRARAAYADYLSSYGTSSYAWVAALRVGACDERTGNWKSAAEAYRRAGTRFPVVPLAQVLGHAYGARAAEALGQFETALAEYRSAIAGWDKDYGTSYSLRSTFRRDQQAFTPPTDESAVRKDQLAARTAELARSLSLSGGADLERGRWLLFHGRRKDAVTTLDAVVAAHPAAPVAAEARYLSHLARLDDALDLANADAASRDAAAALRALDALVREPCDFAIFAAKVARASLLRVEGKDPLEQESAVRDAFREFLEHQRGERGTGPHTDIERDVEAIRAAVFLPAGGGVYGTQRWNAFAWPSARAPFLVTRSDTELTFAGGDAMTVTFTQVYPGLDGVVRLTSSQLGVFSRIVERTGGTRRREWTREAALSMQVPNQPIGDSMVVLGLLNKAVAARPGHWGGWVFETYPIVTKIEFLDAGRTRAVAKVTVGFSGCDVILEKAGGAWKAIRMTNQWIT